MGKEGYFDKLIDTMEERIRDVIAANGGPTRW
jgi:hypothetical protein